MAGRLALTVSDVPRQIRRIAERLFGRAVAIDAAGTGKRWARPHLHKPARAISTEGALAASRAWALALNNVEAAAIVRTFVDNVGGDGPSIRPLSPSKELNRRLAALFNAWWDRACVDGILDLASFINSLTTSLVVAGEFFVHFVVDPASRELRLHQLAPEQLRGLPDRALDGGGWISSNVEFDASGRRVAYWVRSAGTAGDADTWSYGRIPASDVVHGFEARAPGQVRGLSMLAPAATVLSEIASLRDALLSQAKTGALFGGIIYNPNAASGVRGSESTEMGGLEPGGIISAPPGWQYESITPPKSDGANEFLRAQVRAAAAGTGVPYAFVSGDLSDTNYSSAKVGLNEFRRRVVTIQRTVFVSRFLQPLWRRWLLLEVLSGRVPETALTTPADFIFPAWRSIDPARETNADIRAIEAKIRSRHEVISSSGRDPETVDAEIAQDAHQSELGAPA